jgi:hypothetical protein
MDGVGRAGMVRLLRREDLALEGWGPRALDRAVADGRLRRVRAGVYVWAADVAMLSLEERAVVRARALTTVSRETPPVSHLSAAAVHSWPWWGAEDKRVHVTVPPDRPGGAAGVIRHRGDVRDDELVEVGDLRCTSRVRTLADVARTAPFLLAVCVADAAVREVACRRYGEYNQDAAEALCDAALTIAARSAHGVARARRVLAFADGRAQLPGESVSRVHLTALGFAELSLQVHVPAPDGGDFWVDFGFDDVPALGEFDGKGKYRDILLRRGLSMEQVLEREKQREDWIRGVTQRPYARWSAEHIGTAPHLGRRLAAFGIAPRGRRAR